MSGRLPPRAPMGRILFALLALTLNPWSSASAQWEREIRWLPYDANPANRPLSLRLEYVHWWMNENDLPALVTTSPQGTPVGNAGVLGLPGTETLFGDEGVDDDARGGMRGTLTARLAHWFDHLVDWEVDVHLTILGHGQDSGQFVADSSGDPILARPFFDGGAGSEAALLTAYPGLAFPDINFPLLELTDGRIEVGSSSDFDSAGVLLRRVGRQSGHATINLLAGYRYLKYQERLSVAEFQIYVDPGDPTQIGTVESLDAMDSWNEFHGGELGIELNVNRDWVTLQMLAKVAIGNVHQILTVDGFTEISAPDPAQNQTASGGLLTAPSNIGRHTDDRVGIVPEFGVTLRTALTPSFVVTAGYTCIAFPHVLRTGDQIDTTALPAPTVLMNTSTLWIHGAHVGAEF